MWILKCQTLFSSKDKSKKNKMLSAAIFVWGFKSKDSVRLTIKIQSIGTDTVFLRL